MATTVCIRIPNLPSSLEINLPGLGLLKFARDSLTDVPRVSDIILKAINSMSPVLAPINSMIKIMDVIIAIVDLLAILPKVMPFNIAKLLEALQKLFKAFNGIIALLPPLAYLKLAVDISMIVRYILSDLTQFLLELDRRFTYVRGIITRAVNLDDPVLLEIGYCSLNDTVVATAGFFQVLEIIMQIMAAILAIMRVIASLLPPKLRDKVEETIEDIEGFGNFLTENDSWLQASPVTALVIPPFQEIAEVLTAVHNIIASLEMYLRIPLGLSTKIEMLAGVTPENG